MSMREIVLELQKQGHEVDFYVRKDGGILVKRIDGTRYPSGASGNARARELAGAKISEARRLQLKYATRARKISKPKEKNPIYDEWKRIKKKWNKAFKAKNGEPHPAGYLGWGRIQRTIKVYGEKEALRRLREAEKYASGLAYSKNVQGLADFIKMAGEAKHSQELIDLSDDIKESAYTIRDEWIYPAYEELYKLNKGVPIEEVVTKVRAILRLSK